jgi:hypothetical protein
VKRSQLVSVLCLLLGAPVVTGQVTQSASVPPLQILGPELIAWSYLQQPQPVPQSFTDRTWDRNPQPVQDGSIQRSPGDRFAEQHHSAVRSFTGLIEVIDGHGLLKLANNTALQLDDAEKARQYEGRQVNIAGTLDESSGKLHVISIVLDS